MLAARQQTYWWHRARRFLSLGLLRRFGIRESCKWLDIGCGPGGNLSMLTPMSPALVAGVDLSPTALDFARRNAPGARLVRADISRGLSFAAEAFDVVTIFNVLYHRWMPDEKVVLREVFRVLRPGGLLLITEPAFAVLEREMDELTMGRRRYRLQDISALCQAANLKIEFDTYFTSFGFPMLLAAKLASGLRRPTRQATIKQAVDMKSMPVVVNETIYQLARLESRLIISGLRMPFGVTLLCLARRP
jgi:SAM-dependent methyltransferase